MVRTTLVLVLCSMGPVAAQTVIVRGLVTNELTGDGISTVSVIHDERVLAITDVNGAFVTPAIESLAGTVTLAFRRLGFAPHATTLRLNGRDSITVGITLRPIPTTLDEIVVDGSTITIQNPGLVGFYERRAEGRGRYITERELDRAKSYDLTPYLELRLRTSTLRAGCSGFDRNVVYLDGIRWFDMATINQVFPPTTIGGIEVYARQSVHLLPTEFIPAGPFCTVTMVWTRQPLPPSGLQLGVYAGPLAFGTGPAQTFVGGQIIFPLRQGTSTWRFHAGYAASGSPQGDRWHVNLGISVMPLGYDTNWYTGAGVSLAKAIRGDTLTPRPQVFTGAFVRIGVLRPFLEARLVGANVLVLSGLNLLFGPE